MGVYDDCYATDADVRATIGGDYPLIVPPGQMLSEGDGEISVTGPLWSLTATGVDFAARGLGADHVVTLGTQGTYSGHDVLVTAGLDNDGVGPGLKLARPALSAGALVGLGQPPKTGATEFAIPTFLPQIIEAGDQLEKLFQIADRGDLLLPDDWKRIVCWHVACACYGAAAPQADKDNFWKKKDWACGNFKALYETLEARYAVPNRTAPVIVKPINIPCDIRMPSNPLRYRRGPWDRGPGGGY